MEEKVRAIVLSLKAIMNREVMHVNFCLFSAIFAVPRIVEIQKFCYHGTLALPLLLSVVLILAPQSLWFRLIT